MWSIVVRPIFWFCFLIHIVSNFENAAVKDDIRSGALFARLEHFHREKYVMASTSCIGPDTRHPRALKGLLEVRCCFFQIFTDIFWVPFTV